MSKMFDRIVGLVFILVGVFFILESRNLSSSSYGSGVGPDLFPMGLGIILILLSIRLMIETFRYPKEAKKGDALDVKRFGFMLLLILLYVVLFEIIGYVLSTFLFLVAAFQIMERGRWLSSVLIAGVFAGVVYYVYVEVLKGTLPAFPF
jgi:putative tricarboxylic transport membrane protein